MSSALPGLLCPSCNEPMAEAPGIEAFGRATSFETCVRRCAPCEIGASNALSEKEPTFIHRKPLTNIPEEARDGALEALRAALNIRNRAKKESYFGFSTSEDAVTWVVFDYLKRSGLLLTALHNIGLGSLDLKGNVPSLLLWGVPVSGGSRGTATRDQLVKECIAVGENPAALSEPDVIIDLGEQGIVFIEVKYLSGNDNQPYDYTGWHKYASPERLPWAFDEVRASGCYELSRYWCFLEKLADGRKGWLVNLGLSTLFSGREGDRLDRFVTALGPHDSLQFRMATWGQLLAPLMSAASPWFTQFCCRGRRLGLS